MHPPMLWCRQLQLPIFESWWWNKLLHQTNDSSSSSSNWRSIDRGFHGVLDNLKCYVTNKNNFDYNDCTELWRRINSSNYANNRGSKHSWSNNINYNSSNLCKVPINANLQPRKRWYKSNSFWFHPTRNQTPVYRFCSSMLFEFLLLQTCCQVSIRRWPVWSGENINGSTVCGCGKEKPKTTSESSCAMCMHWLLGVHNWSYFLILEQWNCSMFDWIERRLLLKQ